MDGFISISMSHHDLCRFVIHRLQSTNFFGYAMQRYKITNVNNKQTNRNSNGNKR